MGFEALALDARPTGCCGIGGAGCDTLALLLFRHSLLIPRTLIMVVRCELSFAGAAFVGFSSPLRESAEKRLELTSGSPPLPPAMRSSMLTIGVLPPPSCLSGFSQYAEPGPEKSERPKGSGDKGMMGESSLFLGGG